MEKFIAFFRTKGDDSAASKEVAVKTGREFLKARRKKVREIRAKQLKAKKKEEAKARRKRARYTDSTGPM